MPKYLPLTVHAGQPHRIAPPEMIRVSAAEMQPVVERLLIAGLREQDLADELRQQLAFTAAVNDSIGEGVYALDTAGRITFVNPAAEQLLGWTQAEVADADAHALLHKDCAAGVSGLPEGCSLFVAARTGTSYRNSSDTFRRKDGAELAVAYSSAPILINGEVTGTVVVFRDETARRLLEQQRGDFFAAVAHDMGTPLTVIKGTAQFLRSRIRRGHAPEEPELLEHLARIETTANRMNLLVTEVLDLARLRFGQVLDLQRQVTDLVALTRQAAVTVQDSLGNQEIQLTSNTATLSGLWDAGRLERVIGNVLTNAVKYSRPGGSVMVSLACLEQSDGRWASLTVTDQGIGVPAADLPHIFERFHRGSNVVGRIPGTGIGLHGSRQIIEQHGGTITLDSRDGHGTTVTIRLPLGHTLA